MSKCDVLIVDDEPDIRELLEITLQRMSLSTRSVATIAEAHQALTENSFSLCLSDMNLPDGDGLNLVDHIQENYSECPIAIITAYGSVDTAINALKKGAFDFLSKPVDIERLRDLVQTALKVPHDSDLVPTVDLDLTGESSATAKLRRQILKLARSEAPVYIGGESGSGKELVARLIHANGARHDGPFVAVNCGAIPGELMESEFFGHRKGSFTGAVADKDGLFKAAQGGSLFLDEVADLPLDMQVKLLRAIQEKQVRAVGSNEELPVDARILSATHKDLAQEVELGRFRQDLYYRINVIELRVPPLRERVEDIPALAADILGKLDADAPITLADDALQALQNYSFPGNVRELQNVLERARAMSESQLIRLDDLELRPPAATDEPGQDKRAQHIEQASSAQLLKTDTAEAHSEDLYPPVQLPEHISSLDQYLESVERAAIERALEANRWNKTAAAEALGISFRALRYKLKKLDIK